MHPSLPSARQPLSYGDCLEVKREYYQNCSVLGCVTRCSQSAAHLYEQFLQVQQIGFVTLGPLRLHRGGCLELYYCNMVEWCWWDLSLVCKTNWFPSVIWHCWFGHMTCKNRPRYDLYNVFGGTLNLAQSINPLCISSYGLECCPEDRERSDALLLVAKASSASVQECHYQDGD